MFLARRRPGGQLLILPRAAFNGLSFHAYEAAHRGLECRNHRAPESVSVMYLMEFSMSPLHKGESVSAYVARSLDIIDASGLDYRLHAMGTIVEGELDQLTDLLKKCFDAMAADCDRITCSAKFDYRQGAQGRLDSKVASVKEKLERDLKTDQ